MKKFLLILLVVVSTVVAKAQVFGEFSCKDPDAWFDTEIYFVATNEFVYNGYPQNIRNVAFCVDGEDWYNLPFWQYGTFIQIDGSKMSKGSVVSMFVDNHYMCQWECTSAKPSFSERMWDKYKFKVYGGAAKGTIKGIIKLMKYIR